MQVLAVIQVEDERLAAAGGHPVGQLGQVVCGEGNILRLAGHFGSVALSHEGVQVGQQLRLVAEQTVEHDFGV